VIMLRPAGVEDVPAMTALARRAWAEAFATAPAAFAREWLARDFEQGWYPRHWPVMTVAEVHGAVVGLVQPDGDEVNGLWVAPEFHGQGVGSALLAHAETGIAAAGHRRAWLTCSALNPRAVRFYEGRGYRECGRQSKMRADGVVEEVITFARPLAPPPELSPAAGSNTGGERPGSAGGDPRGGNGGAGAVTAAGAATSPG
jgi:[ribosomal protein S18]-alanine N-acetyltransferase